MRRIGDKTMVKYSIFTYLSSGNDAYPLRVPNYSITKFKETSKIAFH